MFQHFKDIDIHSSSTWKNKRILTFDIDWASDDVLSDTIDLIERYDVKATFFVTHYTSVLSRLRKSKNYELAIHPNFNPFFEQGSNKKPEDIISELKKIVPEATVSRSHSLTNSGRWNTLYNRYKIKYTSNYIMYMHKYISPILQINNTIEVPIYFADDGFLYSHSNFIESPDFIRDSFDGIQVFLFHPIHVALNTSSLNQYELTRDIHHSWDNIQKSRSQKSGIRNLLANLLDENGY